MPFALINHVRVTMGRMLWISMVVTPNKLQRNMGILLKTTNMLEQLPRVELKTLMPKKHL